MKFILPALIAFSFAGFSYAEPSPATSDKALGVQDEAGETNSVVRNMANWLHFVGPYLARYVKLPEELRKNGPWGDFVVRIKFTVSPEGDVSDAQIEEGSGNSQVDTYALDAVRAVKLFPFTPDMGDKALTFILPIEIKNPQPAPPPEDAE